MKPHYKSEPTQLEHYQSLQIQALQKENQRLIEYVQELKDKYEPKHFAFTVDINDPVFHRPMNIMEYCD